MPTHFEYVLAAYGIWVLTFAVYLAYLRHKSRTAQQALQRMSGGRAGAP